MSVVARNLYGNITVSIAYDWAFSVQVLEIKLCKLILLPSKRKNLKVKKSKKDREKAHSKTPVANPIYLEE